ncbi:MAG: DUF6778 family protein [Paracoccaceae bacterium]
MNAINRFSALTFVVLLTACGQPEQPSRAVQAPEGGLTLATQSQAIPAGVELRAARYAVQGVSVTVPSDLRASEANVYYPLADIVWRGDALGNRHEQVRTILRDAATEATAHMTNGPAAFVEITLNRFHSVTEKTRYSVGGVHSINYTLTVRDAATGSIVDGPRVVVANAPAAAGMRAMAEDQAGRTMKVVITELLVASFRAELSAPVTELLTQANTDPAVIAN